MSPRTRLSVSLLLLIGVYLIGAVGYATIEGRPIFDALYMAAITISTVGYDEYIPLSPAGRVWTVFFILFGLIGATIASTSLVSLFVSGDVRQIFGRRKMQAQIDRMTDHVLLCGFGRMGKLTVEQLGRLHKDVVVIERDAEECERLHDLGIPVVQGDAIEEEELIRAGLMSCGALVAALPHDSDNVYITLTAHGIRPELTIVARAEQPSTEPKLKRAGATRVICPQVVGASKITHLLTRPNVVDFLDLANMGLELEVDEYRVEPNGNLCDRNLREAPIRSAGAIVVAIKRRTGETIYPPEPDDYLRAGDTLILIGKAGVVPRLRSAERASP